MTRIGLISDTHGLLRPEATAFLTNCDRIIHGGDVGNPTVLTELSALCPLTVVRGNNDSGAWADALLAVELAGKFTGLIATQADIGRLDLGEGQVERQ